MQGGSTIGNIRIRQNFSRRIFSRVVYAFEQYAAVLPYWDLHSKNPVQILRNPSYCVLC